MPVVAETYDGLLNDINGLHVTEAHARSALDAATTGPVSEGNVGGGTGMICYDFKGGTGTASREVSINEKRYRLGVLVQANHGRREDLRILGVPVGQHLVEKPMPRDEELGSIIVLSSHRRAAHAAPTPAPCPTRRSRYGVEAVPVAAMDPGIYFSPSAPRTLSPSLKWRRSTRGLSGSATIFVTRCIRLPSSPWKRR